MRNLTPINGPLAGTSDRTTFTPDLYGRVRTTTSPGAYTLTFDYDALDRPTLVTYPDGTTEQFSYQRANGQKILDLTHFKDRENRWTLSGYDALRQRIASIDPLNRLTRFHWCYCGALQDLWDAEGNKTHWDYDFTGRLTKKTYADGKETSYANSWGQTKYRIDLPKFPALMAACAKLDGWRNGQRSRGNRRFITVFPGWWIGASSSGTRNGKRSGCSCGCRRISRVAGF
jgi:YD repeat-containing protein